MTSVHAIGTGALHAAHAKAVKAAEAIATGPVGGEAMTRGIVALSQAETAARSAAAIVRAGDEMTGVLLDILS